MSEICIGYPIGMPTGHPSRGRIPRPDPSRPDPFFPSSTSPSPLTLRTARERAMGVGK